MYKAVEKEVQLLFIQNDIKILKQEIDLFDKVLKKVKIDLISTLKESLILENVYITLKSRRQEEYLKLEELEYNEIRLQNEIYSK